MLVYPCKIPDINACFRYNQIIQFLVKHSISQNIFNEVGGCNKELVLHIFLNEIFSVC